MLENIILFFGHPKKLFGKLKDTPDVKKSLAILIAVILAYYIGLVEIRHVEISSLTFPRFFSLIVALVIFAAMIFSSVILDSFYILLFSRIFGKGLKFSSVFSAVIYCSIPLVFVVIARMILPINLTLPSFLSAKASSPFLGMVYQRIGIVELWINIMEVIAIKTISELSYKKVTIIILSSWLVSIVLTYLLDIKVLG